MSGRQGESKTNRKTTRGSEATLKTPGTSPAPRPSRSPVAPAAQTSREKATAAKPAAAQKLARVEAKRERTSKPPSTEAKRERTSKPPSTGAKNGRTNKPPATEVKSEPARKPAPDPSREGPRIYNLFPLLAGPIPRWREHLERIVSDGFNWVYLNPIYYPGFSGSLYAIKDPERFHPLFQEGTSDPERSLREFLSEAGRMGVRVMIDLVINHTAKDAALVGEHPDWYRREKDGSLYSPRAVDPDDASHVTIWGDLAELDYSKAPVRKALIQHWKEFIRKSLEQGFAGFRCDAAYKVPAGVWKELIASARDALPGVGFFAETLGCTLDETEAVAGAGFDYLFNSSKWWNFHDSWALDQYEALRRIVPTISFPETHDTLRLADETGGRVSIQRMRYLFAAFFSTGLMMPMGYEFGFRKKLNVVSTRPSDWEPVSVDLSPFIAAVNAMKKDSPVLNEEGPMAALNGASAGRSGAGAVVRLIKRSEHGEAPALAWIHTAEGQAPAPVDEALRTLAFQPNQVRVFSSEEAEPGLFDPLAPWEMRLILPPRR